MIIFNNKSPFNSQVSGAEQPNPRFLPPTTTLYHRVYALVQNTIPVLFNNSTAVVTAKWAATKQPYQTYPSLKAPHPPEYAHKVFSLGIHQLKALLASDWETNARDLNTARTVWFKVLTNFWKQKRLPTNQLTVRKNTPFYKHYLRRNETAAQLQYQELIPQFSTIKSSNLQKLLLNFSSHTTKAIFNEKITTKSADALYARFFFKLKKKHLQITTPFKYHSLLDLNLMSPRTFTIQAGQPMFNIEQVKAAGAVHETSYVKDLGRVMQTDHRLRWLSSTRATTPPTPASLNITTPHTSVIKNLLNYGPNSSSLKVPSTDTLSAFKKSLQNPLVSGGLGSSIEGAKPRAFSNLKKKTNRRAVEKSTGVTQTPNRKHPGAVDFIKSAMGDYLIWANSLTNSVLNPIRTVNSAADKKFSWNPLRKSTEMAEVSRYITIPSYKMNCLCISPAFGKKTKNLNPAVLKNLTTERDRCWSYLVGEFIALRKPSHFKSTKAVDPSTLQPFFCNYCSESADAEPRKNKMWPNIQRVGHGEEPRFMCTMCSHCTHEQRGLHLYDQLTAHKTLAPVPPLKPRVFKNKKSRNRSGNTQPHITHPTYVELLADNLPTTHIDNSQLFKHKRCLSAIIKTYFTNSKFLKTAHLPNASTPASIWFSIAGKYPHIPLGAPLMFSTTTPTLTLKKLVLLSGWVRELGALFELPTSPHQCAISKHLINFTTPNILEVRNALEGEEIPRGESASSDISDDFKYGSGILYTTYPYAQSTAYKGLPTSPLTNPDTKTNGLGTSGGLNKTSGSFAVRIEDLIELRSQDHQPYHFLWTVCKTSLPVTKVRGYPNPILLKVSPTQQPPKPTPIPQGLVNTTGSVGLVAETWITQIYSSINVVQGKPGPATTSRPEMLKWAKRVLVNSTKLSQTNHKFTYKVSEKVGYGISTIYDRVQGAIKELPEIMRRNVHVSSLSSAIYRLLVFKEVDEWTNHIKSWYQKHGYKTHKRIFYTFRRLLNSIYLIALYSMRVVGLYFQLKGKVNSKGGMRKRVFRAFHGRFGSSSLLTIFQYKFKQIWCKTGAIGLKTVMVHRTRQYIPKCPVTNRISGHKLVYTN